MKLLLAALATAMAWSYLRGTWSAEQVATKKPKKNRRREHSVFARSPMIFGDILHGVAIDLRRVSLIAFGFLRAAGEAMKK